MDMLKKAGRKLKFFFDVVVKSLTKFDYYNEIRKAKFKFSVKYLFFLFYILSLVTSIIFAASIAILVIPNVPKFVNQFQSKANSLYPEGLVINVKNGIVSTNEKEPYSIDTLNQFKLNNGYDHFITIDTKADPSNIKNENTAILITKDSVVTIDKNKENAYQVYPIDTSTNYVINKNSYLEVISKISPYFKYIEPVLIALIILSILLWPVIGGAISLTGQLIYLVIFSAIFFVVIKLMKKNLSFKKLLQLAMHAATLPILLSFIVSSLGIQMPFMLGSAILFVFMILVVNNLA
jgi:hypothetical protein